MDFCTPAHFRTRISVRCFIVAAPLRKKIFGCIVFFRNNRFGGILPVLLLSLRPGITSRETFRPNGALFPVVVLFLLPVRLSFSVKKSILIKNIVSEHIVRILRKGTKSVADPGGLPVICICMHRKKLSQIFQRVSPVSQLFIRAVNKVPPVCRRVPVDIMGIQNKVFRIQQIFFKAFLRVCHFGKKLFQNGSRNDRIFIEVRKVLF